MNPDLLDDLYRVTMEDVVFVLAFVRDSRPRSSEAICRARQEAFRARADQPERDVKNFQTIEANCLRHRGITPMQFDAWVWEWLSSGNGQPLHDGYVKSFRRDRISGCPGWSELFEDIGELMLKLEMNSQRKNSRVRSKRLVNEHTLLSLLRKE